jgi:thiamine biosynthesis protein ThiS
LPARKDSLLKLTVNGEPREVAAATVFDLIQELGLHPQGTIVERNLEIVDLASYGETILANGDELELVRIVGGG